MNLFQNKIIQTVTIMTSSTKLTTITMDMDFITYKISMQKNAGEF
jgi:hypothetical protein